MEKTVTVEKPIVIGDVTLIAVARSSLKYKSIGKGIWLFGMKLPIALVVISGSLRRAFRSTGEEVSIDQLMEEIPEIGFLSQSVKGSSKNPG
ncbi:hypothetical protein ACFLYS_01845 [Chloroflexota bacterium]